MPAPADRASTSGASARQLSVPPGGASRNAAGPVRRVEFAPRFIAREMERETHRPNRDAYAQAIAEYRSRRRSDGIAPDAPPFERPALGALRGLERRNRRAHGRYAVDRKPHPPRRLHLFDRRDASHRLERTLQLEIHRISISDVHFHLSGQVRRHQAQPHRPASLGAGLRIGPFQ